MEIKKINEMYDLNIGNNFKTELIESDIDIIGLKLEDDYYITNKKCIINWSIEMDYKKWGIESLSPTVSDTIIKYTIVDYDGVEEEDVEVKVSDLGDNWIYGLSMEKKETLHDFNFAPFEIEIDFNDKRIEVRF